MDKEQVKSFFMAIYVVAATASVFSVFKIHYLFVLLINFAEIVVYLIVFHNCEISKRAYLPLFIVLFLILLGFMIAVMVYPTKVCGGVLSSEETEFKWFGKLNGLPDEAARIKRYRLIMGIFFTVLSVYNFVLLIVIIAKKRFGEEIVPILILSAPLFCVGGILMTCIPWFFVPMLTCGALYAIAPMWILYAIFIGNGGDSSSHTKKYDVYIFEHDD